MSLNARRSPLATFVADRVESVGIGLKAEQSLGVRAIAYELCGATAMPFQGAAGLERQGNACVSGCAPACEPGQ